MLTVPLTDSRGSINGETLCDVLVKFVVVLPTFGTDCTSVFKSSRQLNLASTRMTNDPKRV